MRSFYFADIPAATASRFTNVASKLHFGIAPHKSRSSKNQVTSKVNLMYAPSPPAVAVNGMSFRRDRLSRGWSNLKMDGVKVHKPRRGFTLVEMLVTITVLLILTSLLTAALGSAKRKARLTQCTSNLKQHGVALHSFLAEHSVYPLVLNPSSKAGIYEDHYSSIWSALDKHGLGPCTDEKGSVHVCPSAAIQERKLESPGRTIIGYAYNVHGMGRRLEDEPLGLAGIMRLNIYFVDPVPESSVVNPTEMVAMGDGVKGWDKTYEDGVGFISRTPDAEEYAGSNRRVPQRHQNRLTILFADGHVNSLTLERLFKDRSDDALRIWNRDNQPHRERLN